MNKLKLAFLSHEKIVFKTFCCQIAFTVEEVDKKANDMSLAACLPTSLSAYTSFSIKHGPSERLH